VQVRGHQHAHPLVTLDPELLAEDLAKLCNLVGMLGRQAIARVKRGARHVHRGASRRLESLVPCPRLQPRLALPNGEPRDQRQRHSLEQDDAGSDEGTPPLAGGYRERGAEQGDAHAADHRPPPGERLLTQTPLDSRARTGGLEPGRLREGTC
jgi:hypothetical protein